jgi:hypothetical protein
MEEFMSSVHSRLSKGRLLFAALVVVAFASAAAACGGAHSSAAPATPHSLAAAWHRVVLCARAHGMPNAPDPQIDANGNATFPSGLVIPAQTRRACQSLYDRLIPNGEHNTPTPAQLASLLRFAHCMRSHGIPDWPDPLPDGTFAPDTRILHALKSTFRSQMTACERFNPDTRGRVYFSNS